MSHNSHVATLSIRFHKYTVLMIYSTRICTQDVQVMTPVVSHDLKVFQVLVLSASHMLSPSQATITRAITYPKTYPPSYANTCPSSHMPTPTQHVYITDESSDSTPIRITHDSSHSTRIETQFIECLVLKRLFTLLLPETTLCGPPPETTLTRDRSTATDTPHVTLQQNKITAHTLYSAR